MKNSHIALLSSLFINSIILSLDPCVLVIANPPAFAACNIAKVGFFKFMAAATATTGAKVTTAMGVSVAANIASRAISSDIPAAQQPARPLSPRRAALGSRDLSGFNKLITAHAPQAAPAPARVEQPTPPTPPTPPNNSSWRDAGLVAAGLGGGIILADVTSVVRNRIANDLYDEITGVNARKEKEQAAEIARQLSIQQEEKKRHVEALEENLKLRISMDRAANESFALQKSMNNLGDKMESIFKTSSEESKE